MSEAIATPHTPARRGPATVPPAAAWVGALFLAVTVAGDAVWRVIRSHAPLTGDAPHYLVVARALSHGSVHPAGAYRADLAHHRLFDWPAGLPQTTANLHLHAGPHGQVSIHGLGLPLLLAPFVAAGGTQSGILGLIAVEAVGLVYCFVVMARTWSLGREATVAWAIVISGPAVWVASTQLNPDFPAGVALACVAVSILAAEVGHRLSVPGCVAAAASLAILPWLHIKNLLPAALLGFALVIVGHRAGLTRRVAVIGGCTVASWLILAVYNLHYFSHPLGVSQPFPSLGRTAAILFAGLLFDRHQGLFVQVPTVALGVLGVGLAIRRAPFAAVATVLSVVAVLVLNAAYVGVPYGGAALAGRFQWSAMVPMLVWSAVPLARIARRRRLVALAATVAVLWIIQAAVLVDHHTYVNQVLPNGPWDPTTYPGWWAGANRLLPKLVPHGALAGVPSYGIAVAAVALALGMALCHRLSLSRELRHGWSVGAGALVIALALVAALVPPPLPSGPLTYPGTALGSPITTAAGPVSGAAIPLSGVGAGTFQLRVRYRLGMGAAQLSSFCSPGSSHPGGDGPTTTTRLGSGAGRQELRVRCSHAGVIWVRTSAAPTTRLDVYGLDLTKTQD